MVTPGRIASLGAVAAAISSACQAVEDGVVVRSSPSRGGQVSVERLAVRTIYRESRAGEVVAFVAMAISILEGVCRALTLPNTGPSSTMAVVITIAEKGLCQSRLAIDVVMDVGESGNCPMLLRKAP